MPNAGGCTAVAGGAFSAQALLVLAAFFQMSAVLGHAPAAACMASNAEFKVDVEFVSLRRGTVEVVTVIGTNSKITNSKMIANARGRGRGC